jgi:hypothetical protein
MSTQTVCGACKFGRDEKAKLCPPTPQPASRHPETAGPSPASHHHSSTARPRLASPRQRFTYQTTRARQRSSLNCSTNPSHSSPSAPRHPHSPSDRPDSASTTQPSPPGPDPAAAAAQGWSGPTRTPSAHTARRRPRTRPGSAAAAVARQRRGMWWRRWCSRRCCCSGGSRR